jgi:glutamyl-tRNA reductase
LHGATTVDLAALTDALSTVDVVVCATASVDPLLTVGVVQAAVARRGGRPLLVLDLAVPRDVEPAVADLPGVTVVDIARLGDALADEESTTDRVAAEEIVATEVEAFLIWMRGADVAPTVAALRTRADEVVTFELGRLAQRRPDLTDDQRAVVAQTVHRVVQRLLHPPTVRVRQLAATPDGDQYAAALRELFDLEVPPQPDAARAVEVETFGAEVGQ